MLAKLISVLVGAGAVTGTTNVAMMNPEVREQVERLQEATSDQLERVTQAAHAAMKQASDAQAKAAAHPDAPDMQNPIDKALEARKTVESREEKLERHLEKATRGN
jgi:hypothetical protein